jgi:glycosyltransferase involved in cell wall biosynthesis
MIPTYNRLTLLKDTLNSVWSQVNSKSIEIIVVDDGSEDGTWEFLKEVSQNHSEVKIHRHSQNLGVSQARNSGLNLAKGQYIFFLDSDDILLNGALEKIKHLISQKRPEVLILNTFREKGVKLKFKAFPLEENPLKRFKAYLEGAYSEALYVVKREVAYRYPFHPGLKVREDFSVKAKWLIFHNPLIINEAFGIIREHPQRLRHSDSNYFSALKESVELLFQDLPEEFQPLKPYALFLAYIEGTKRAYRQKNFPLAKTFLKEAEKIYHSGKRKKALLKLKIKIFLKK